MYIEVNYAAVLIAGLAAMLVGSIWYLPKALGSVWAKLARVNLNKKVSTGQMIVVMGSALLASLVTAYILASVTFMTNYFLGDSYLYDALIVAFWLWFAMTALRLYVHDAFEGRAFKLTLVNAGYDLVAIMLMGLIIGLIGR